MLEEELEAWLLDNPDVDITNGTPQSPLSWTSGSARPGNDGEFGGNAQGLCPHGQLPHGGEPEGHSRIPTRFTPQ